MPTELHVQSYSDIQPIMERLLLAPGEDYCLTINPELDFKIVLRGATWDGFVDVRVAKYVIELQSALDRTRKETEVAGQDRPLVKVEVKDGSTEIIAKIEKIFTDSLATMDSADKMIVLLGILIIGGGYAGLRQILAFLSEKQARQLAHGNTTDTVRELNQTIQFALEKIDPERPIRTLIKGMQEEDTIKLPAAEQPLSRTEARARYPRKPRVNPIDVIIDDNYHVDSVSLEQPVKLSLTKGPVSFKAVFSNNLGAEDKDAFLNKVKATLETYSATRVALQINASVGDSGVTAAVIVAIGKAPREGAEDILEYLE